MATPSISDLLAGLSSTGATVRTQAEAYHTQQLVSSPAAHIALLITGLTNPATIDFSCILLRRIVLSHSALITQSPLFATATATLLSPTLVGYSSRRLSHLLGQYAFVTPTLPALLSYVANDLMNASADKALFCLECMCDYAAEKIWVDCNKNALVQLLQSTNPQSSATPAYVTQHLKTTCAIISAAAANPADLKLLSTTLHAVTLSNVATILNTIADDATLSTLQALTEVALTSPTFYSATPATTTLTLTSFTTLATTPAYLTSLRLNAITLLVNLLPHIRKDATMDLSPLYSPAGILPTLLNIMPTCTDADVEAWATDPITFVESEYEPDDECRYAAELLESIVHDLPAKATFPLILPTVQSLVTSSAWQNQKAGLEVIRTLLSASPVSSNQIVESSVTTAVQAFSTGHVRVQYQALTLLGAICNRTSEVSASSVQTVHAQSIVQVVKQALTSECIKVSHAACGVIISFCRGSSNDNVISPETVAPLLPQLLSGIAAGVLARMNRCEEEGVCVLAVAGINALACVADAAGQAFEPHYAEFVPGLLACMTMNMNAATGNTVSRSMEENGASSVRGAAMEAVTLVGAAVGGRECAVFVRDAEVVMGLVMGLLKTANRVYAVEREATKNNVKYSSPPLAISMEKVQRSAARISGMMEEAFAQFMPAILPHLLKQAKQKNEMAVTDGDEAGLAATNSGEVERDLDMGTESLTMKISGVGIKKLTINTSVVQEKSAAARAVTEHACSLGSHFAPFSKICVTALLPLVSFQYSAEVRVAGAQALSPVFDAACALAVDPAHVCFAKVPGAAQLPQQLFGSIVNTLVKQLGEERGEPETLVELATAISDVTRSAYVHIFEETAGMHVAKLALNEGRSLVTKLTGLVGECLERRRLLFDGMANCGDDEDEIAEYEEALYAESDILTPLVDSIGYTLKCAGVGFVPVFDSVLAPTFGKFLTSAGNPDTRARFAAVCLFDDCIEFLGAEMGSRYAPQLLPGVLEGINDATNDDDLELKQASVYGVAQIARVAPGAMQAVAGPVAQQLYEIITAGPADEDEVSLIENAVSALAAMCVFRGAPFAACVGGPSEQAAIKEIVLNAFPITEDETEAHVCHDRFADMVEIGDPCCVGGVAELARAMKIIGTVLRACGDGDNLAAPSTISRFTGLLTKLQSNPNAAAAWGLIEGDVQSVIGRAVQGVQVQGAATITP